MIACKFFVEDTIIGKVWYSEKEAEGFSRFNFVCSFVDREGKLSNLDRVVYIAGDKESALPKLLALLNNWNKQNRFSYWV